MIPEILIIIAYFVTLMVPVATVVLFFKLDSNPETSRLLPELDSYYPPDEGYPSGERPAQLPDDEPAELLPSSDFFTSRCDPLESRTSDKP